MARASLPRTPMLKVGHFCPRSPRMPKSQEKVNTRKLWPLYESLPSFHSIRLPSPPRPPSRALGSMKLTPSKYSARDLQGLAIRVVLQATHWRVGQACLGGILGCLHLI